MIVGDIDLNQEIMTEEDIKSNSCMNLYLRLESFLMPRKIKLFI